MTTKNPFEEFDFRPRRPIAPLALFEAIGMVGLILAWWLVPRGVLLVILLPIIAALIWVASFGWRQALARLIEVLQEIQGNHIEGF